jgi:hypothetical protein
MTPLRIATFAREISANVTGRDSRTLIAFLGGCGGDMGSVVGIGSSFDALLDESSSTVAEKGRGVEIGYLKLVALHALILDATLEDLAC